MKARKVNKVRVIIVDDHDVVRQGIRAYLELHDQILVVGEASDGQRALDLTRELSPDVVLMDLVMPRMDGVEATKRLLAEHPDTKVIILSSFTEDDKVFPAIQAGATSYLLKDVKPAELAAAILASHRGESQLHPEITKKLMEQVVGGKDPSSKERGLGDLTERELEVLQHLARGLSNRELADALTISEKTVKTHVSSILSKLHLSDRTQAAIYAHKHGLVNEDE
jgi:NarL family two-component system response regulator LiaR